jgi:hypothetical protein
MSNGYVYIIIGIVIVSVGTFAMFYFRSSESYNAMVPKPQVTPDCVRYIPKATALAENSIGQATMSSYDFRLDGVQCVWGYDNNDTRELAGVRVSYQSPSGWAIIFTEDPMLTKVINSTIFEPKHF